MRRLPPVAFAAAVFVAACGSDNASTTAPTSSVPGSTADRCATFCASTTASQSATRPLVSNASPPIATPTPTAAPTLAAPALTSYGALDADWERAHTPSAYGTPGAVYNDDPSLPQVNGHPGAHYFVVEHVHGYVTAYNMAFNAGTPIRAAIAQVMAEFPSETVTEWTVEKRTCYQLGVRSARLGVQLGSPAIGDGAGRVFVEFDSDSAHDGQFVYDATDVREAIISLGSYPTVGDAPAC